MLNFLDVLCSYSFHRIIHVIFNILKRAVVKCSCFHLLIVTKIFISFVFIGNDTLLRAPQLLCTRTQNIVTQLFQETSY
jgi:hypothetical protein